MYFQGNYFKKKNSFYSLLLFLLSFSLWLFLSPLVVYAQNTKNPVGWAILRANKITNNFVYYGGDLEKRATDKLYQEPELSDALNILKLAGKNKTVKSIEELYKGNLLRGSLIIFKYLPNNVASYKQNWLSNIIWERMYINQEELVIWYLSKEWKSLKYLGYYSDDKSKMVLPGFKFLEIENEIFKRIINLAISLYHENQHRWYPLPSDNDPKSEIKAHFAEFSLLKSFFVSALEMKDGVEIRYLKAILSIMNGSIENMDGYYKKLNLEDKKMFSQPEIAKGIYDNCKNLIKEYNSSNLQVTVYGLNGVKGVFGAKPFFPTNVKLVKWGLVKIKLEFRYNKKKYITSSFRKNLGAERNFSTRPDYLKAYKTNEKITFNTYRNLLNLIHSKERNDIKTHLKNTLGNIDLKKFKIKLVQVKETNNSSINFQLPSKRKRSYDGVLFNEYQVTVKYPNKIKELRFIYDYELEISGIVSSTDGTPLQDAVVSTEIDGKPLKTTSYGLGRYKISIPWDVHMPTNLKIKAKKKGFKTSETCVKKDDYKRVDIKLTPIIEKKDTVSGCWEDDKGRTITIKQNGTKVTAIYSKYGNRKFKGFMKNGNLSLFYVFKDVNDYASIPWIWDNPNQPASNKILKQALKEQAKHDWGFKLKIISRDKISGESLGHRIAWEDGKLTDFSVRKYPTTWRRRKIKLNSISVTDSSFKKILSEVSSDSYYFIKATASSGCKEVVDYVVVSVYPKYDKTQKIKVELIETGSNTLEFHSPKVIIPYSFKVLFGDIVFVRSGLKGTSFKIAKFKPNKVKTYKTELLEEKKWIKSELMKIENSITQHNLHPDAFGEGLKETLQKELEYLNKLISEQMDAKIDLLRKYKNIDVSDYDKEIKSLKLKRESVKEQLRDVSLKVEKEFRRLKIKKAELEKRLKEILKELNY